MLSNKPKPTLSFNSMNLNDTRLLHHFKTITYKTLFPPQSDAARTAACQIPSLTLEHDFMMHCILGIASLHLHRLQPEKPELQALAVTHRVKSLNGLRKAISQSSQRNFKGILVASLTILILASDRSSASPGQLWVTDWFALWAGMHEMIRLISWEYLVQSGLSPMFMRDDQPQTALGNLPIPLVDLIATMDSEDENAKAITDAVLCLGKLYEYLLFPSSGADLKLKILKWPASIQIASFVSLLRQMHPQALVVVSYYLVFTKLMDTAWWMDGVSDPEIEAIASTIPLKYQSFMLTPMQAAHLRDKRDIAKLLLSQLPVDSILSSNATAMETVV